MRGTRVCQLFIAYVCSIGIVSVSSHSLPDNGHLNLQHKKHEVQCEDSELVVNPTRNVTFIKIITKNGDTLFSIDDRNTAMTDIDGLLFITRKLFFPTPGIHPLGRKAINYFIVKEYTEKGLNLKVLNGYNVSMFEKEIHGSNEGLNNVSVQCINFTGCKVKLETGLDVNHRDGYNMTSLIWASLLGDEDVAKELVEKGADVKSSGAISFNPLVCAIYIGKYGLVEYLIKHGANVNEFIGKKGMTPLHIAAFAGQLKCAQILLDNGAGISVPDKSEKMTPLHYAISLGEVGVAKELISRGANVNVKTEDGNTPLHAAVKIAEEELIHYLIQSGADINSKNNENVTPLIAALRLHEDFAFPIVKHLIEHHRPDLNIKSNDGKTALSIATEIGYYRVQNYLKEYGAV